MYKFEWCHIVSLLSFFVDCWDLHMPGSLNSIMPSEVNNLDDWFKLPRWRADTFENCHCVRSARIKSWALFFVLEVR